jgi:hypothetical protein
MNYELVGIPKRLLLSCYCQSVTEHSVFRWLISNLMHKILIYLSCAPVKKESSFLTGAQDSHLQRVKIPEAAYIQLRRRPPEDEQANARNM